MKKILSVIVFLLLSYNIGYSSYVYYPVNTYKNYSCKTGSYSGFIYPSLVNYERYYKTKSIYGGSARATLICKKGSISIDSFSIICNSGYYEIGDTCVKEKSYDDENYYYNDYYYSNNYRYNDVYSNNNYNNTTYNRTNYRSCNSGIYDGFSYPSLSHLDTHDTSKSISGGNIKTTFTCRNGRTTRGYLNVNCNSGYRRSGDYCRKDSTSGGSSSGGGISGESCNSGTYYNFSHPSIDHLETYSSSKNITGGEIKTILTCRNGTIGRGYLNVICNSGYRRYGDICREDSTSGGSSSGGGITGESCNSGTYYNFSHPSLDHLETYSSSKNITGGEIKTTLTCRNGSVRRGYLNVICDSGYRRSGDSCKESQF